MTEKHEMVYMFDICEVVRKTEKATLIRIDDETFWLPSSKIMIGKTKNSNRYRLAVDVKNRWLLDNVGLLNKAHNGHDIYNYAIVENPKNK